MQFNQHVSETRGRSAVQVTIFPVSKGLEAQHAELPPELILRFMQNWRITSSE